MFGFRPNAGCHGALKELSRLFEKGSANYAVGADAEGFFNMERERMLEPIKFRTAGPGILWLAGKTPAAGIMENGSRHATAKGPEQGNPASPAAASICMRCALAQWFGAAFKKQCRGECGLALCAGGFAAAFLYRGGAYYFPAASAERFAPFGLEPEQAKTRLAEFGKHAGKNRKTRGRKKPETFDFLGSARYCSKSGIGKSRAKRKTARKKFQLN
jgi:hypothetical protein